jgi:hypothetical protein
MRTTILYKIIITFFLIVYFHPSEKTSIDKKIIYFLLLSFLIVDLISFIRAEIKKT